MTFHIVVERMYCRYIELEQIQHQRNHPRMERVLCDENKDAGIIRNVYEVCIVRRNIYSTTESHFVFGQTQCDFISEGLRRGQHDQTNISTWYSTVMIFASF